MFPRNRVSSICRNLSRLPHAQSLLICMGFAVLIAALYGNLLTAWWGWDDSMILKHAFQYAPWEYFFAPDVWREYQPANLNPWLILSYDLDLALFGLNPSAFYAHHLLALWLVAVGTYVLLRLWLDNLWSIIGVTLFICSAPVTTVLYQLTNRHYLEGLLFSTLVFYLYVRALRDERPALAWLGLVFYFLAISAKEVYVTLILLLPFLQERDLRRRLFMASPFFVVLGIYALWRRFMLGRWVGGYFPSIDWSVASEMALKIPSFIFGDSSLSIASILLIITLLIYAAWRNVSARILIMGAVLFLLGPILPALSISNPKRLLFFFCWALSLAVVLSLRTFVGSSTWRLIVALAVVVVIGFSTASQGWRTRSDLKTCADGYAAHGRFILRANERQALLPAAEFGHWYAHGLLWIRRNILLEKTPIMVFDEIDLAKVKTDTLQFFRYDSSCRYLRDVSEQISKIYAEWRAKLRDEPLSVMFSYEEGYLSWHLGPYKVGKYSLISYNDFGSKLYIPASGAIRCEIPEPLLFRIRYDSLKGWTTYSPLFQFDGKELLNIEGKSKNLS